MVITLTPKTTKFSISKRYYTRRTSMYCKRCGSEIDNSSFFCSKCGQKINSDNINNDFFIRGGVLEKYLGNSTNPSIPEGVVEISREAFQNCAQLKAITFPSSMVVAHIIDCHNLERININNRIKKLFVDDCKSLKFIELPNGIERVRLNKCAIQSLKIPASVKAISDDAFSECVELENIMLPDGIEIIGKKAFYHCIKLKKIDLPDSIHTLGKEAFRQCKSLKRITIPSKVTTLPAGVFQECHSLTEVIIPSNITRMEGADGDSGWYSSTGAFMECTNLKKVTFTNSISFLSDNSFKGCKNLTDVSMPFEMYNRLSRKNTMLGDKHKSYIIGFENTPISWKYAESCQYCGSKFKGMFNKKCSRCGKPKDY